MASLSKNAQMVKFFAGRSKHGIGRTKLLKLVYLADLEARKLMGQPISGFDYVWHNHGPFDHQIYAAVEELEAVGLAHTQEINHGSGFIEKRLIDDGGVCSYGFSAAEHEILAYVASRFMAVPLRELLDDVVYESRPMRAVDSRGDQLPMEIVDNSEQRRLGFDFEEIVKADADARDGAWVLASEFFDGLRAKGSGQRAEAN